ncbi:hypothetical protein CY34DRAFT_801537 [Suillus luteus UH-Slu-Lm8-n1]|uniref:Uncharacterized protein n=1 Tax=Suillus luteus UH-Slu-Lm8-n1 TaxID=930992 RepID=A0A0D0AUZ0_9AGAM|nr:hypothetical protein CY34DRAFT_801537 [Suillus luteus UH-Slu-Lm8-n1]
MAVESLNRLLIQVDKGEMSKLGFGGGQSWAVPLRTSRRGYNCVVVRRRLCQVRTRDPIMMRTLRCNVNPNEFIGLCLLPSNSQRSHNQLITRQQSQH